MRRFCARLGTIAAAAAIATVALTFEALAEKRVALVVGNGAYRSAVALPNPPNDAADMAAALRELNFEVILASNVDKAAFDAKLRDFAKTLRDARMALFYYAGHGMQVAGKNYAVPVDARLEGAADLPVETVDIDQVLSVMQADPNRVNLVFLDACRDNPLTRSFARALPATRSAAVGSGLSQIEAGRGTLIAFATAPNRVALDGKGRNSPFTSALLKHIRTPGLDIAFVLRRVTADVEKASNGTQVPWMHASLFSDVVLKPGDAKALPSPPPPVTSGPAADEIAWPFVKDTKEIGQLQRFVDQYPLSKHRAEASSRIAALKAEEERNKPAPPPQQQQSAPPKKFAALNATAVLLRQYQNWGAYAALPDGQKLCFAMTVQNKQKRGKSAEPTSYLSVSSRPQQNITNELSIIFGYRVKPDASASLEVGGKQFKLYVKDNRAWVMNIAEESTIVALMRTNSELLVKATDVRGSETIERYSLRGIEGAVERANQECR